MNGEVKSGLDEIGVYLKAHLNKYNWVSVQAVRFGPIRRASDEPMGVPAKQIRLDVPKPVLNPQLKPGQKLVLTPDGPKPALQPSAANFENPGIQPIQKDEPVVSSRPNQMVQNPIVVPRPRGFPVNPPAFVISPVFVWPQVYRNLGTPGERIRRYMARRLEVQNARNASRDSPRDMDNEEREMRLICS